MISSETLVKFFIECIAQGRYWIHICWLSCVNFLILFQFAKTENSWVLTEVYQWQAIECNLFTSYSFWTINPDAPGKIIIYVHCFCKIRWLFILLIYSNSFYKVSEVAHSLLRLKASQHLSYYNFLYLVWEGKITFHNRLTCLLVVETMFTWPLNYTQQVHITWLIELCISTKVCGSWSSSPYTSF